MAFETDVRVIIRLNNDQEIRDGERNQPGMTNNQYNTTIFRFTSVVAN